MKRAFAPFCTAYTRTRERRTAAMTEAALSGSDKGCCIRAWVRNWAGQTRPNEVLSLRLGEKRTRLDCVRWVTQRRIKNQKYRTNKHTEDNLKRETEKRIKAFVCRYIWKQTWFTSAKLFHRLGRCPTGWLCKFDPVRKQEEFLIHEVWLQKEVVQKHEQCQFSKTEISSSTDFHLILRFFYTDVYLTGELLSRGKVPSKKIPYCE